MYEVIVGNIGSVYRGGNPAQANKHFREYVSQSKSGRGRAGGEDVTLMKNDEPIKEYQGELSKQENPGNGLRRYPHPGKYEGGLLIDEYVHQLSISGMDDEAGDTESTGWYGLFKGVDVRDLEGFAREAGETFTKEEKNLIRHSAGVIIYEDSQGFVDVTWYDSKTELMKSWEKIVEEIEESMDEGGEDEEYEE